MSRQDPPDLEALRRDIVFECELRGSSFTLHSTWGLFSPREVDTGTLILLDTLEIAANADCLDLGCGYGPLGLAMARAAPEGRTLLVDRDVVAVAYARANAARNGLANAEAMASNGFAEISDDRRFDLIVSNLPAKVGREMLTLLVYDAAERLRPGGQLSVVTISHLRPLIRRLFEGALGNYEKVKQASSYTVSRATKPHGRPPA